MFDAPLRGFKDRLLGPLAGVLAVLHPIVLTMLGLLVGLAAALAAALGWLWWGLVLWVVNRVLDGLDGLVARRTGRTSDLGGYLDLAADFLVYAAVPLGLAWYSGQEEVWMSCAFLLGSYYVNAVSWLALSALEEKRRSAALRVTTLSMPRGLMEGFETLVLYAAFFLWPDGLLWLFGGGALLVLISAGQRVFWAVRGGLR